MKIMKNKCLILITVFALFALFPLNVFADGANLTVQSVEADPGDTVTVPIIMADNPGFSYLKIRFSFDNDKLDFVNAENGTVSTDAFTVTPNALSWDTGTDATSNGTLVNLIFTVKENAEGTAAVSISVAGCFNYDEQAVEIAVTDGAVTLKGGESTPFIKGDVDGDGTVTSGDARLALRASVRLENYAEGSREFLAADVDENGTIEAADARYILRASVQLEDLSQLGK